MNRQAHGFEEAENVTDEHEQRHQYEGVLIFPDSGGRRWPTKGMGRCIGKGKTIASEKILFRFEKEG